jgi:hypothetical protein
MIEADSIPADSITLGLAPARGFFYGVEGGTGSVLALSRPIFFFAKRKKEKEWDDTEAVPPFPADPVPNNVAIGFRGARGVAPSTHSINIGPQRLFSRRQRLAVIRRRSQRCYTSLRLGAPGTNTQSAIRNPKFACGPSQPSSDTDTDHRPPSATSHFLNISNACWVQIRLKVRRSVGKNTFSMRVPELRFAIPI